MASRQFKNDHQRPSSDKTEAQIINDLIENRKCQMEALIKIMVSIDMAGEVEPQPETPSKNVLDGIRGKGFKRRTKG